MIRIKTFVNRPIDENTYVVSDDTRDAVIIDCGALFPDDQQAIADYISREDLRVTAHILTHGHFDHMFGAQWVADTYGCAPLLHPADATIYASAVELVSAFFHRRIEFDVPPAGGFFEDHATLSFGTHTIRIIPCAGHTRGGVCLYLEDEGVLFSGDSIFQGSIGRCDLPGGNEDVLLASVGRYLPSLPRATQILPGHGYATTVGEELDTNPYMVYLD